MWTPTPDPSPQGGGEQSRFRRSACYAIGMTPPSRIVTPERRSDDVGDTALRPQLLSEFVGQQQARANLQIFIDAARKRGEALDHVLFVGPPGLGKTTLAQIVARELGVGFRATSGPVIAKAGDLAALLTNLEERDVLFIDEIHRLSPAVEEVLYPAMEDFQLDLIIGEGPAARSVKIDLSKFTLVGATTRAGSADQSAARPFRHSGAAEFLHHRGAGKHRHPRRPRARHRHHRRTAPTRSPAAPAARRASPAGCCAGCATSPRRPTPRRSTAPSPTTRSARSKSTPPGSTPWTGAT